MEAREVPAAYFWLPTTPEMDGTYSSAVAGNWRDGPSMSATAYTVAPGWQDDLYFRGDVSVVNCTIPDMPTPTNSAGLTFNSINLLFGQPLTPLPGPIGSPPPTPTPTPYTGIVTIKDSFAIGTLQVDTGAISQADPAWLTPPIPYAPHAGTLTVTTALDWTGGTLNSNTTLGYIDLAPGATGIIEPSFTNAGINQTVELGSTIRLLGTPVSPTPSLSSTMDVLSGTYNIKNNAGFEVGSQCNLQVKPQPGDAPPPSGGGQTQVYKASVDLLGDGNTLDKSGSIEVAAGGTLTFVPKARPPESTAFAEYNAPKGTLKNEGGTVNISDRVKATFGGKIPTAFPTSGGGNYEGSVYQTAGTFSLQAGSQVITATGVAIHAGEMVSPKLSSVTTTPHPEAVIESTSTAANVLAFLLGADAKFGMPELPYRTLRVKGNFFWAGTVKLGLNPLSTQQADMVEVDGYVRIVAGAKLNVVWDLQNDATMAGYAASTSWAVVTSTQNTDGILGDNHVNPPGVPIGTAVTMETQASTDKKTLYVRKK